MEVSEDKSFSVSEKEEFSKQLLHPSHIGANTPAFTIPPLTCNPDEAADSSVAKTASLTISACLFSTNSSLDASKTAPFYPRVVDGRQPPVSPVDATGTLSVLSESEPYSQQQTRPQLPTLPTFCGQATIANPQLFPLILAATPASSNSNSVTSTFASIHVKVNNNAESTVVSTNTSAPSLAGGSISALAPNTVTSTNGPSSFALSATCSVATATNSRSSITGTPPNVFRLCPASRVLIHKNAGQTPLDPGLGSGTGLTEPFPLTFVPAPVRTNDAENSIEQLSACAATSANFTLSGPSSTFGTLEQSPQKTPAKAKSVSLATPVPANARLFTTSSTTVPYSTKGAGTGGIYTASIASAFSNATVISPGKSSCAGPWTNLSGSNGVTPNSLVALQSTQPLLVHITPELVPVSPAGVTSSSQVSFVYTRTLTCEASGGCAHATAPMSLNAPTVPPTVLAFSPSTTTPSSINVSSTGVLTHAGSGVRPGAALNSLVVRRGRVSTVTNAPTTCSAVTYVASLTSSLLLKPLNLSIPGGVSSAPSYLYTSAHSSVASPSSGATVPQGVPINIAPARRPSISTGLTASSPSPSISTSLILSPLQSAISSFTLSPRHNLTSVFSYSSNRKRARTQQLAATSAATASTTSSAGLPVVSSSTPIANSQTTTYLSTTNPVTVTAIPLCNTAPSISIAHFTPMPHGSGQSVAPTIVAIPKPIIQPTPPSNTATLPLRPLTALSPRLPSFSAAGTLQMKVPNTGLLPSSCPTGLVTTPAQLSTISTNAPGFITRLSTGSTANCASDIVPTTISGTCSAGVQQLRLATTPEVAHTEAVTVYVLTTSNAYPVLSSRTSASLSSFVTITSTVFDSQSSVGLSFSATAAAAVTATTPSYGTALMMLGMGPGVIQVRLRPPLTMSATTTSTVTSTGRGVTGSGNDTPIGSVSTPLRPQSHPPTTTGSGESTKNKMTTANSLDFSARVTPLRFSTSFTSNSSLLHRHLLSPQNPVHNEHGTTDMDDGVLESQDSDNPTIAYSLELFSDATVPHDYSVSGDHPTSVSSVPVVPFRHQDIELHCSSCLEHDACSHHHTGENQVRITAAADMATEGVTRLDEEEDEEDL
ncbi:hypothetical protein FGIG_07326 [Fasciola gigantica]|uniref:Uncharacterized protein n=1 Tax=Fasciola gigantica TaxID=46835 RepID=A0A504YPV3_FASGI|nr:hypothetical protein FGIG_07326 [Fasciola gigantica]